MRACHIGRMNAAADSPEQIATLRVELLDTDPLIWRQVEVPTSISLKTLHNVIQAAMGWFDMHLWEMRLGKQTFGLPMDEDWGAEPRIDGAKVRLSQILGQRKTVIDYIYDFGDSWEHRLTLSDVRFADPGVAYPRYTARERSAPPEDCGGVPGYYAALEARADPRHPEHADIVEWLDGYDPEEFDDLPLKLAVGRIASRRRAAKGPKNKAAGQ
jgi:hypothetical protein